MTPIMEAMELELGSRAMGALIMERFAPEPTVRNRYLSAHPPIKIAPMDYRKNKVKRSIYVDEVVRVKGDLYWVDRLSKKGNLVCTRLEAPNAGSTAVFNPNKVTAIVSYNTNGEM